MTVSTTLNKVTFNGNGVTTVFPFTFPGVAAADLQVFYTDASGNLTLLSPSVYSVTLNAAVGANPTGAGGSVTYNPGGSPIATGTLLTIYRSLPLTQTTSLANQGTMYPAAIEQALDYIEMTVQQVSELQGRALTVAVSDSAPANLPPAAQRANLALTFDANGNPIASSIPSSGVISSAMAPVVSAASLAAGRTAFGLGALATLGLGTGLQNDGSSNARVDFPISSIAVNTTIAAANHLNQLIATGPINLTLPRANTLWSGFGFFFKAVTGAITLIPDSHDTFQYGSLGLGANATIKPGARVFVTTDAASAGNWYIYTLGPAPPTVTTLTSGTGTYTVPLGCTRIRVVAVAGGGGGAANAAGVGNSGVDGGDTTFNAITAAHGAHGTGNSNLTGGAGGAGGTGGAGAATIRYPGAGGGGGATISAANGSIGGFGGGSLLGPTTPASFAAGQAGAGYGAGGSGASATGAANVGNSGGGGGGEAYEYRVNNPAATYTYTVGAAGTAGAAGVQPGGAGSAGVIIIEEFYDE